MPYLHSFADQHCSNCGRTSDFQLLSAHALAVQDGYGEHKRWRAHDTDFRGLFFCGYCKSPVTLDFRLRSLTPVEQHEHQITQISQIQADRFLNRLTPELLIRSGTKHPYASGMAFNTSEWGTKLNRFFTILNRYPDSMINAPTGIPRELDADFAEIRDVVASPRYTVIACRRLLERACKLVLGDDAAPKTHLIKLIDLTLTRAETLSGIADWAHAIRAIGNEAVHDDAPAPTEAEAKETFEFTSLLVELLFSYPNKVSSLRKES